MKATYKIGAINVVALFLFLLDRALKFCAQKGFFDGREFGLFGWFRLKLAYNSGVAFGIGLNYYLIIVFYFIIIFALVWYLVDCYRAKKFWGIGASTLIIVGAVSNLFDRISLGKVVDYFYLKNFSIFNLADVLITVGVILLMLIGDRTIVKEELDY